MSLGGTLAAPVTAYLYDWNMLPIGQLLWTKELYTFKEFPPLQAPETYNLNGILKQMERTRRTTSRFNCGVNMGEVCGRSKRAPFYIASP